jgi:hypothetical protein
MERAQVRPETMPPVQAGVLYTYVCMALGGQCAVRIGTELLQRAGRRAAGVLAAKHCVSNADACDGPHGLHCAVLCVLLGAIPYMIWVTACVP